MRRNIAVNRRNQPIGEDHPRAELTDREVDLIRDLYRPGTFGYKRVARTLELPVGTVRAIINCSRRATTAAGYRTITEE